MMTTDRLLTWIALALVAALAAPGSCRADAPPSSVAEGSFDDHVKPLLASYCVRCHGGSKPKGDRRFDRLDGAIPDDNALVDLQDILDQLNLEEMPPVGERQPSEEERRRAVAWLTGTIAKSHADRRQPSGETVLRRLNAREYRNTIRDLLHLDTTMFDPTTDFPRDRTIDRLDIVGESLVMSGYQLQRYLAAADRAIDKVFRLARKPPVQTWAFRDGFRQQPEIDQVHGPTNGFSHITLYDVIGADKPEGAYGPIAGFKEGVPFDGTYEIRIKAEALNRLHPYDDGFVGTDRDEPLRLGIVAGTLSAGPLYKTQPIEPLLAEFDLADEPRWYTARVRLDAGFTPRFTFRNGLMDVRNMWGRLVRRYRDQFPPTSRTGIGILRLLAIKHGKLPQIQIHEVEIEGPFYDEWPPAGLRAVLGDDWGLADGSGELADETIRRHLTAFASRAYRRPAREEEIDRLMQLIAGRRQTGRTPLEAYRDGLGAVLCSPGFLYLEEPGDERLSPGALASRLSYFLWSSMPDRGLLELATAGRLDDPEILAGEVRRLLRDPRSEGFLDGFLDGWLGLRDLGSMPPDREKFEVYYRDDLKSSMRMETRLFTRHLLDRNLSIENFLDSDFTFIDKALANHYGLEPPRAPGFERVSFDDRHRGGLLGQASVLTVTANGIDTSPVVRGVWLLENILGTPPSPPPPDVEPLDPDVRGATTIRDQLEKHRSLPSCYGCHRKIDPPGFALENFDAIGAWRDRYGASNGREGRPIDPAGQLSDGQEFDDVAGLKALLTTRRDQFAHCLTEKLLAYATGRVIEAADRPAVDQIVAEVGANGYGLEDLILSVVRSEPFQAR